MASDVPVSTGAGDDDFVYEGVKLQTAEDYKQHRKVQAIIDAQETVLERRETAYEILWEGRIDREDYLKAIRMAVERYLMLSEQAIRENELSQWFWEGEPPTVDKRSPFDDDGKLIAIPENAEVELDDGTTVTAKSVVNDSRYRLNKPLLVAGDDGEPIFGTEPNVLGIMPMPEVDRQLVFQGLESFMEADDPIVRQTESVEDHPTRLRESKQHTYTYQVPESVTMEAFRLVNDFWWGSGMSVKLDKGQSIIRNFDMSGQPEYRHTDGSPPV